MGLVIRKVTDPWSWISNPHNSEPKVWTVFIFTFITKSKFKKKSSGILKEHFNRKIWFWNQSQIILMILNWLQYLKDPQEGWGQYLRDCCRQWTKETVFVLCLRKKEKEKTLGPKHFLLFKCHWNSQFKVWVTSSLYLSVILQICVRLRSCGWQISLVYYSSVEKQSCYMACFSLHLYVKDLLNMTFLGYIFKFLEFSL